MKTTYRTARGRWTERYRMPMSVKLSYHLPVRAKNLRCCFYVDVLSVEHI